MWHKIALIASYLVGGIVFLFLALIIASKIWKKYKKDKKHLQNIARVVGALVGFQSAKGVFKRTKYRFFLPNFKHNSLILEIKAKSPIRLVIIKREFKQPFFMLKQITVDDPEIDSEYLFFTSNLEIARKWLKSVPIMDEIVGIMHSGCYKLDIRQNSYRVYWKNLTQLELKYLPEWVGEAIDRAVALKGLIFKFIESRNLAINPNVWRYLAIFTFTLLFFLIVYFLVEPLDILYIIFVSMAIALPFVIFYVYKIVSFSFRANKLFLGSSITLTILSFILAIASFLIIINRVFVHSKPEYIKVQSLEITPIFGDLCIEKIELENKKILFSPTAICDETKNNLDIKVYKGRLNFEWADIDRVATKLSLVDVYSAFEAGDLNQALKLANKYIELNPKDIYGYYARGKIYLKLQKYNQALNDMNSILEIDQHQLDAYLMIDKILSTQQKWKKVILYWTQLIKLEPNNAKAYHERAGAYFHNHQKDLAKEDLEKACKLGTKSSFAKSF